MDRLLIVFISLFSCSFVLAQPLRYEGLPNLPGSGKHVVLISGDEEYRSEEMVVQLGRILATRHGFDCTVLFAINPATGEIDPEYISNIPHLETLATADVMLVNLRFRNLPDDQMKHIDDYLKQGKPVLGIRTSTHAFAIPQDRAYARYSWDYSGEGQWNRGFGRLVLGETWITHHGSHARESTRGIIVPERRDHPIVRGVDDIFGPTNVYQIRLPLPGDSVPLVYGQVLVGMNSTDEPVVGEKNDPMMPIAWTKTYQVDDGPIGRVFTSTKGSSQDLESEDMRRLLVNAVYWLAGLEDQIPMSANVDLVGSFKTLPMGFGTHKKGMKPQDFLLSGYTDTPFIPGSTWRVHDKTRPLPQIVEPGVGDLGATPPSDAIVLFGGENLDQWIRTDGNPIEGGIENGTFDIMKTGQLQTKQEFGDFQLHIEWRTPELEEGFDRMRQGNSGVFLMGLFEIQILESNASYIYADGNAGALYGTDPPLVNPARGPLEWQSFDIFFTAPKFEGETLKALPTVTVLFNGVLVHKHRQILGATRHRDVPGPLPVMEKGPLMLQRHGSPVEFRNIWIRPL